MTYLQEINKRFARLQKCSIAHLPGRSKNVVNHGGTLDFRVPGFVLYSQGFITFLHFYEMTLNSNPIGLMSQ